MARYLSTMLAVSASAPNIIANRAFYFTRPFDTQEYICRRPSGCRLNSHLPSQNRSSSSFDMAPIQNLEGTDANNIMYRIAYRHFAPAINESGSARASNSVAAESDSSPSTTFIFLNGLLSNMSGTKSRSMQMHANKKGARFLCFDYRGHGRSSGNFSECTMHDWMEDARTMLDHALLLSCKPPRVVLIGSSVGAWIALRLAMERQHLISGVIGIGAAIDFTHFTFQALSDEQKRVLTASEVGGNPIIDIFSPYLQEPYPFSRALHESGDYYLLCHKPNRRGNKTNLGLALACPVRFLHGLEDDVVYWSRVTTAAKTLESKYHCDDISVKFVDDGDHRLSRQEDIFVLLNIMDDFF